MNSRLTLSIVFSFLVIFLTYCERQPSETSDKEQYYSSDDPNNMNMRDGVPVFPAQGSKIENSKVDSMLKVAGTSFSAINPADATVDDLKNNVKKLTQLLRNEYVLNDKELQFAFHTSLGNVYLRLFRKTEQNEHLELGKKNINSAISLLINQPKYKADLAEAYMARISAYALEKKYDEIITLMKYLIEDYQKIGFGPYKNWFASYQVTGLHNLAHRGYVSPDKAQEIVNYLAVLSKKYENEVGAAAQIELLKHYLSESQQTDVKNLSGIIENRLKSLNNPAFSEDKWIPVKNHIKRIRSKENAH